MFFKIIFPRNFFYFVFHFMKWKSFLTRIKKKWEKFFFIPLFFYILACAFYCFSSIIYVWKDSLYIQHYSIDPFSNNFLLKTTLTLQYFSPFPIKEKTDKRKNTNVLFLMVWQLHTCKHSYCAYLQQKWSKLPINFFSWKCGYPVDVKDH